MKKNLLKVLLLATIMLLAACGSDESENEVVNTSSEIEDTSNTTETTEEAIEEPIELSPEDEMIQKITNLIYEGKAYDVGSYIQGDIPKGDYAFVTFDGSGEYYSEKDQAGDIVDNENFDSFGYVYVHGVGNIQTDGVLIKVSEIENLGVSNTKELFEILNQTGDFNGSAWYKVGTDIPEGQYVIESINDAYVAIMSGPVGNNKIIDNDNFNGKYSVSVKNGQYLVVSGGTITKQ
ncbi:hypothetical protein ABW02_06730 [Niallia circulans]|uniref:Uncharacterized protein n=1 Tax=Niallia circulans TaxID=1397 RepID=A0A0J1IMT1_NIACI|nr:hypothetical protein [Niallia circulans]KLV27213.1 hypothetical protein ABW02_06730 [Niallia circulans]